MSRRSRRRRKRARQKARFEQRKVLQHPPKRPISTGEIFEMLKFQSHVLATVLAEAETKS